MSQPELRSDGNNAAPRSTQNKSQLLQATMRNVPKLKELNYAQWKNVITNSIKNAKLWEYVDGTIEQPSEDHGNDLEKYFDEAGAVRNAILGSLEPRAQLYIEEALNPRDAWLTLERKYLTAEADVDAKLVSIEKQLNDLRLEEGGDIVEHIAEFFRMRSQLSGTRFALDDLASISMLYRSLPPTVRQSVITPEGTEMRDLGALCARLSYLSQNPEPETPADNASSTMVEDYTDWGVPADIKSFGLTGDKNPLLKERATVTCRDCLLKDHKAGTPDCPQYEWRKELWGFLDKGDKPDQTTSDSRIVKSEKKLTYEFSEPMKVVTRFNEMGLRKDLIKRMGDLNITIPSAIQQCAIIPMITGRNVLAQAPKEDGKTVALAISILQAIDTNLPNAQALVLTRDKQTAKEFHDLLLNLTQVTYNSSWVKCYLCDDGASLGTDLAKLQFETKREDHIVLGTPVRILELVRRKILETRHLKVLAIDNVEQAFEAGFKDQIMNVRRCLTCSLNTIATFTTLCPGLIQTTSDIMADPLHITVHDNSVFFHARHFFLVLPPTGIRQEHIYNACKVLSSQHAIVVLNDIADKEVGDIAAYFRSYYGYSYTMTKATSPSQCEQNVQSFLSSSYSALITTDSAPLIRRKFVKQRKVPLINYHTPSNAKAYAEHLDYYIGSGKDTMVVTFIAPETDEIRVIREVEQRYGIQMVELDWNEASSTTESALPLPRNESATHATTQVLEAMTRNIPKLKEQNYTQWKSAITHSLKATKLWGYIDGSIEEPSENDANEWMKYMGEASAVRSAILGSLEPGAQRHIEEALIPREAWLVLEKQYVAPGNDDQLIAIEEQLVDLRLEEDGNVVEHVANFCRLRRRLHGTRFALDEQASIELLYRSLPPTYRQSILTPERSELKEFSALCARLKAPDLNKLPDAGTSVADTSPPVEDYTYWGVPEDIRSFGLTGDQNLLLKERASVTCRDCLLKDHVAGTPECPQYEWRRELWGETLGKTLPGGSNSAQKSLSERLMAVNTKLLSYEFSEPVKVVLDFKELGLQSRVTLRYQRPSAIQQCAILPIINGRNVLAQAPRANGKTSALAISALHMIDAALPHIQVLVLTPTAEATAAFRKIMNQVASSSSSLYHSFDTPPASTDITYFPQINRRQIVVGTPAGMASLIYRNILQMRHLKLLVLDNVDDLIDAGLEEQTLEIYRYIPPLVQVVASATAPTAPPSASFALTISKLLVDPLRIFVNRDEGMSMNSSHFFIKAPTGMKGKVRKVLFSKLGSGKAAIVCRDVSSVSIQDSGRNTYYLKGTSATDRANNIYWLKNNPCATLVTTGDTLPTTELANMVMTLVIYDIPATTGEYTKLIINWCKFHPEHGNVIITLVSADTDEILTIRGLELDTGIEVAELLWDGEAIH